MLKKNLQETSKKIISITMIIIIIYTAISALLGKNASYAQTRNTDSNNIYNIDESVYPGYAQLLQNLKSTHPNWTFTLLYTDLEWSDVLVNETITDHTKSLVQGKTGEWLCTDPQCNGIPHDGSTWFGASQTAVAYYLDPRNFLTEDKIFQFETLSYIPSIHTEAGVEAILKGTFMSNTRICDYYGNSEYGEKTFAQAIMYAAQVSGASPYHIASRIRQEVGVNGSGSSSGKVSGYEGYFNFYNIGAYASSDPVINGLIYAKDNGWNTPETSIVEGAKWIARNYISIGQDSLYLQKWNVSYEGNLYYHQYQSNIQAPASESSTIYSSYKEIFNNDLSNTSFNFVIPMYKHIPTTISRYPSSSTYVSQNAYINDYVGAGVYIRQTAGGTPIGLYRNGYSFIRIELNAANNGTIWDKVMLSDGTIGYIATQYVMETISVDEISKEAYINSNAELLNGPRTTANGTTAFKQLITGQPVTIVEQGKYTFDGYVWDKIRLSDGTTGYIQSNYVTEGTYGEKVKVTCPTELAIRNEPAGSLIKYIDIGTTVYRIEKATEKKNDYYWDKVITSDGIVGYMARENTDGTVLWLTPTSYENIAVDETNKIIKATPNGTLTDIQYQYSSATLVSGTENLGTGAKININGEEYTVVKLGDVSGDGEVKNLDALMILKNYAGSYDFNEYQLLAADIDGNGKVNNIDALATLKTYAGNYTVTIK